MCIQRLISLTFLVATTALSGCVFSVDGDCADGSDFGFDEIFFGCEEDERRDGSGGGAWGGACEAITNGYCDSDQDTIPDDVEGMVDSDGDGDADCEDPDSDNDGLSDKEEVGDDPWNPVDTDGDGSEDFRDSDCDNDTIPDAVEGGIDTDGDGDEDQVDLDSDDDGILDEDECGEDPSNPTDTDGDGDEDFVDTDSDDDGVDDEVEGDGDTDGDGIPDFLDEDTDDGTEEGDVGAKGGDLLGTSAPECGGCTGSITASGSLAMALLTGLPLGLMRRRRSWEGGAE